jgi:chaperonin GroES
MALFGKKTVGCFPPTSEKNGVCPNFLRRTKFIPLFFFGKKPLFRNRPALTENLAALGRWHGNCYLCGRKFLSVTLTNLFFTGMSVNVKPLADRVLVEPAPAEEKTAFGIIIPDTAKEKPQRGTIVAVGPGKKDEPMTVQVGDTVLYGKYSGTEISVDGNDYLIMRESDLFAVLHEEAVLA